MNKQINYMMYKNLDLRNKLHASPRFPAGSFAVHISRNICGSGSFAVQLGDDLRSGDHLRFGIICGAAQY